MTVAHLYKYKERICIIDSQGQYKKNIRLSSIILGDEINNCLIGIHAFTGYDYVQLTT